MKNILIKFSIYICLFIILISANCNKDNNPVVPPVTGTNSVTFSSADNGVFTYDNVTLYVKKEAVPRDSVSNQPGYVTFSVETSTILQSGYSPLPSGYTLVGKYVKLGPDGFNFNLPIKVNFPASSEPGPQKLVVMVYSTTNNNWYRVPNGSVDTVNKKIGVDLLTLGYFALTRFSDKAETDNGGVELIPPIGPANVYWSVTVKSAVLKYPSQSGWYTNGTPAGIVWVPPPDIIGNPLYGPVYGITAQGYYELWLSYTIPGGATYTWSCPIPVTIDWPLTWTTNSWYYIQNAHDWTIVDCTSGIPSITGCTGTWVLGRPANWPHPTVPYGTGQFQATLTWINSTSSDACDLDLWLNGPNNLVVYYGSKVYGDSTIVLDRDWQYSLGNAVENIYNKRNTMPSGHYKVTAKYYNGNSAKNFNARVLIKGSVSTFSGSMSSAGQQTIIKEFDW